MLRCLQIGLRVEDLDLIDEGLAIDMMIEAGNDSAEYKILATQDDFDKF